MPANLTPGYKAAEAAFSKARDPQDRLHHLREMLREIPKHKGTEHLRAEIKTRIKDLTEELAGPRKGGARSGPITSVHPEGAAQIALIGPANTGKSSLHAALTGSHPHIGPYPFTTQYPQAGMLPYEDAALQLVDLPPIAAEHAVPWIANTLQTADAALLVVDLGRAGCVEQVVTLHELLDSRRVHLTASWQSAGTRRRDLFDVTIPTLLVANKSDAIDDIDEEIAALLDLADLHYPVVAVSTVNGDGLSEIGAFLFRGLEIVRVYTKLPGQSADLGKPFTVRRGDTVGDVALLVHRDLAEHLKYARIWGGSDHDGQQVGREHTVHDGDVLELHT